MTENKKRDLPVEHVVKMHKNFSMKSEFYEIVDIKKTQATRTDPKIRIC